MNPACVADPSHQHHAHDVPVSLSGKSYLAIEGGGLIQQERRWIADELRQVKVGFGYQMRGDLSRDDAEALLDTVADYGSMFSGGGYDEDAAAEGRALLKDAAKLRATLARVDAERA